MRCGAVDVAVLALPLRYEEIICSDLFREPLLAALPAGHPLAQLTAALPLSNLAAERMLLLRDGHCLRDEVLTICPRAHLQFRQVFESDHLTSFFALVANGFGISLVPERAASHAPGCVFRPFPPHSFRRIGYAQAAGHHCTPLQWRFIQWLRAWPWHAAGTSARA